MKYAAWLSVILPGFLLLTINSSGEDSLQKKFRPALIGNPANPRMYTVELQYNP